jgi:hypothetical protein
VALLTSETDVGFCIRVRTWIAISRRTATPVSFATGAKPPRGPPRGRLDQVGSYVSRYLEAKRGVYRLAGLAESGKSKPAIIDRICGRDVTGTLYIGREGKNFAVRSRLTKLVRSLKGALPAPKLFALDALSKEQARYRVVLRSQSVHSGRKPIGQLHGFALKAARKNAEPKQQPSALTMNRQDETDHLTEQVHRLDFAAALRREEEQMALHRALRKPLWLLALIWMAIAAVLFGGGMFAGWLVWHR